MYDELLTKDLRVIFVRALQVLHSKQGEAVSIRNNEATRDNEDDFFATCLT